MQSETHSVERQDELNTIALPEQNTEPMPTEKHTNPAASMRYKKISAKSRLNNDLQVQQSTDHYMVSSRKRNMSGMRPNGRNTMTQKELNTRGATYVVGRNEIIAVSKPIVSHRVNKDDNGVSLPELAPVSKGAGDFSIY